MKQSFIQISLSNRNNNQLNELHLLAIYLVRPTADIVVAIKMQIFRARL